MCRHRPRAAGRPSFAPHNPRQRKWRELWHGGLSERGWCGVSRRLDVAGGEVAGEDGDALLERVDGVPEKLVEAALARLTIGGVGGVCELLLEAEEVGLVRLELGLEFGEFGLEVGDELAG